MPLLSTIHGMYLLKLIAAYSVLPTISSFHSPHRHVISSDNYRSSRTAKKATRHDNLFWPSTPPSPIAVDSIIVSGDDDDDDNVVDDDNILDLALDSVVKIYATHR